MLTLMTGGIFEQSFVCLKHIALLVTRAPEVFADEFKQFYCRYNDPACVKLLKLEILTQAIMRNCLAILVPQNSCVFSQLLPAETAARIMR